MKRFCGILLAAGTGERFGGNKLFEPLSDGRSMLQHALRRLKAALPQTLVVVNPRNEVLSRLLEREAVEVVANPNAGSGMGGSIACGVQAAAEADGWVIALADMPYIRTKTILGVAAGLQDRRSICAPRYEGHRGHPVGFGSAHGAALMQLSGDEGARSVVAANRDSLILFDTADRGVITDIDYPHDLSCEI